MLKIIKYSFFIIGILIVFVLLGGVMVEHADRINAVANAIKSHHLSFMIWRYFMMIIFIFFYPKLTNRILSKQLDIKKELIARYSRRCYAVLLCLLYEVIIVQNILSWIVNELLHL